MRRRLRLLMVSGSLAGGGAERVSSTLLAHLDRDLVEPSLCLLRGPVDFGAPDDVPVAILGKDRPWHVPRTVLRLRRLIADARPDVVFSTIAFVNLVTGAALRTLRAPPPWIARIGSSPARDAWLTVPLRRLYPSAALLLANSRCVADEIQRTYATPPDRVAVCHNPTDFAAIDRAAGEAEPSDPPIILSVGRLARVKRPDLLVEAFALVRRERACQLWLCGDGPLRPDLERRAAQLGGDGVRFLGYRDNPYPLMRQAALFALTSDFEGLPNALIEAQGLGIPAVATRCCGSDEVIDDGVTGLLVPTGDVGQIASAIARILDDSALRTAMAGEARRRARVRFAPAALVRQFEQILGQAVPG